jgi:integrase
VVRTEAKALTSEEVDRLLTAAEGTRWESLFVFAFVTGARRGKVAGLLRESVDLDAGSVTIRASLSQTSNGVAVKSTKTERARTIPLSAAGVEALRRQHVRQAEDKLGAGQKYNDQGYVFPGPKGVASYPLRSLKPSGFSRAAPRSRQPRFTRCVIPQQPGCLLRS